MAKPFEVASSHVVVDADALNSKPVKAVKVAIMLAATDILDKLPEFSPDSKKYIVKIELTSLRK